MKIMIFFVKNKSENDVDLKKKKMEATIVVAYEVDLRQEKAFSHKREIQA